MLISRHLCDALPGDLAGHELCSGDPSSVVADVVFYDSAGAESIIYSPTVTTLTEDSSRVGSTGRLVILRDVTVQRKASETLRRLARITILNVITTAVSEMHDTESIMTSAISRLADLLPADHVTGLLIDPRTSEFVVSSNSGSYDSVPISVGSRTYDSVILLPAADGGGHNLSATAGHLDDFAYRFAAAGLYSVLGHTLSANGQTYGAIVVARNQVHLDRQKLS